MTNIAQGDEWLKDIANRHPFAFAKFNYREIVCRLDSDGKDGEFIMLNLIQLFTIQDCVLIEATPEGWEAGMRIPAGRAILKIMEPGYRIVRLDPFDIEE